MASNWSFVVCSSSGVALGRPFATDRKFQGGVSQGYTASFSIRADDPMWVTLTETENLTLKVYDSGNALRFYGPMITDQESGTGQGATVGVNAADLSWEFTKRYIGKDTSGSGTTYNTMESDAIIASALATINGESATGVTIGTTGTTTTRTITVLWKRFSDLLNELGAITGSYEWALRYTDGTPPTVNLDLLATLGADKTNDVFFEYGTGKGNCSGYSRSRSIEQVATHVYALGAANNLTAVASDAGPLRRREDVITYGDITVTALLDAMAAAHVAARANPRHIWTMTPFAKLAPRFGVDWEVGDLVTARVYTNGRLRIDGIARIWGVEITIDNEGNEIPSPRLAPEA